MAARPAEPAIVDEVGELGEAVGQFGGLDAPQPQLAQARRVRDVAAALQRE
jgi:hypothetical protein